jgi:hypothetical protein
MAGGVFSDSVQRRSYGVSCMVDANPQDFFNDGIFGVEVVVETPRLHLRYCSDLCQGRGSVPLASEHFGGGVKYPGARPFTFANSIRRKVCGSH